MIGELTKGAIEKFTNEIKKEENMDKLKHNVIDPLIQYCYSRLYPYFLCITILFLLIFLMALFIFIILLRQSIKNGTLLSFMVSKSTL
jgi:uncharacterized membrane protein